MRFPGNARKYCLRSSFLVFRSVRQKENVDIRAKVVSSGEKELFWYHGSLLFLTSSTTTQLVHMLKFHVNLTWDHLKRLTVFSVPAQAGSCNSCVLCFANHIRFRPHVTVM